MMSGFHLQNGSASGVAGQRGSFWADPETYDVRRLEFHAEDIPPELLFRDVATSIWYERVRVGDADVLLPQTAALSTTDAGGEESRDVIEFTHCQAFHTESTLSFTGESAAAAPAKPPAEGTLPADLRITIALSQGVDDHTAVGSPIEGKVVGDLVHRRRTLSPDGAAVKGRVRRLERHPEDGGYFEVALEFDRIETPDANLRFYADLQEVDRSNGAVVDLLARRPRPPEHELPGVGTFFVRGTRFLLPPGFKTIWKTRPYPHAAIRFGTGPTALRRLPARLPAASRGFAGCG